MKKMKRFLAVILTLVMATAVMAVSAGAADITIGGDSGITYSAYKLFDAAKNGDVKYYTVDSSSAVYRKLSDDTSKMAELFTASVKEGTTYYVWLKDEKTSAAAVAAAAKADGLLTNPTATAAGGSAMDLADGYYVMETNTDAIPYAFVVMGGTVNGNTTIATKSSLPTIGKAVNKSTASIGETLTYTITIGAEAGALNYKVTDTLPAGLVAPAADEITVTFKGTDITSVLADAGKISVSEQEVTVDLTDYVATETINNNDKFVITYPAVLDTDAVIGTSGNTNTVELQYGVNQTKTATVTVHTYQLTINKTDADGKPLAGAGFTLKNGSAVVNLVAADDANTYTVCADDNCNEEHATEITTDASGELIVQGLGNGAYTLKETTVPAGYVGSEDKPVQIENADVTVTITNTPGKPLPETGGIGTTGFYVVGAAMMLGAAVVVLLKKKQTCC